MPQERRRTPRLNGPFDGTWNGTSGSRDCRITDLNAAGCFIDTLARPEVGSALVVTVTVKGQAFELGGKVVFHDRIQGFGVQFQPSDETTRLSGFLTSVT